YSIIKVYCNRHFEGSICPGKVNPVNYVQAANYYHATNRDLDQALEWIDLYLAEGDNARQFWNVHLKAQILAKMGKNKEAIATAEDSMAKAKANASGGLDIKKARIIIQAINS
ncbi:MAG: hypothetical protein AAFN93_29630, partial [Bacteroidota bacterium]